MDNTNAGSPERENRSPAAMSSGNRSPEAMAAENQAPGSSVAANLPLDPSLEPVSMYHMFARLFAHVSKSVIDRFGEEGRAAIAAGVDTFGEERGRDIARRAAAAGKANTVENYLTSYDMGRSELFVYEDVYGQGQVEQTFTKCPFADQWMQDGMEDYGIIYCEQIDPAIARGFNPDLACVHDQHIFKDQVCHFCFHLRGAAGGDAGTGARNSGACCGHG